MDIAKVRDFWMEEAAEALQAAWHLHEKKDYSYALFFGHLAVEKILKALYAVRKGEQSPYIHNLVRLAALSDIPLSSGQKMLLIQITDFNLEARYPDEKRSFRKKCTEDFTKDMLNKTEEVFQWLKSML
ncbi:MAG: DNA-binding protein [Nitrospira bacterium HGW-Nitrospira-1]|nr:MAG: DNA-binding protein [Nitrospira bacterium HGW-Nitrospira-1]